MTVWAIQFKSKWGGTWSDWTGPVGPFYLESRRTISGDLLDAMSHRPFFFRTRRQAREEAAIHTGKYVKCRVLPYTLTWEKRKEQKK